MAATQCELSLTNQTGAAAFPVDAVSVPSSASTPAAGQAARQTITIGDSVNAGQYASVDANSDLHTSGRPRIASTATASTVPAATSSSTILAANAARLGFAICNTSSSPLYLTTASGATVATAQAIVPALGTLTSEQLHGAGIVYTGNLYGIWLSNDGAANVTEFTA
jgi:hypothetical protein